MPVLPDPSLLFSEPSVTESSVTDAAVADARRKCDWKAKFKNASRGLKLGIRGHSSFFVHFFFAALVLAAAIILRCGLEQWCLLLLCIGLVLTAELFNSAIETMFRGLDRATRERAWPALDIAAGAVLMASSIAIGIGSLIFINRLTQILFIGLQIAD
ncbi:MAG: diacylglycerol kinase [Planctomycetes bacterium]|nr:diacylglycerol kinase [Planctomycetota bacterium]